MEAEHIELQPGRGPLETVLVIDDEPVVLEFVAEVLRLSGYTVLSASSGSEALAILEREPDLDLLIIDVVMPQMSGPEVAQRALQCRPDLRVLFTSGFTDHATLLAQVRSSAVQFIGKPYSVSDLTHKVREVLDAETGYDR